MMPSVLFGMVKLVLLAISAPLPRIIVRADSLSRASVLCQLCQEALRWRIPFLHSDSSQAAVVGGKSDVLSG